MVMTGMEKLQSHQHHRPKSIWLHALENIRDDLENYSLLLISQLFPPFNCDLLVDTFLPTKEFNHADDIHGLSDNLNPRVRLQQNLR